MKSLMGNPILIGHREDGSHHIVPVPAGQSAQKTAERAVGRHGIVAVTVCAPHTEYTQEAG